VEQITEGDLTFEVEVTVDGKCYYKTLSGSLLLINERSWGKVQALIREENKIKKPLTSVEKKDTLIEVCKSSIDTINNLVESSSNV
jgi:hypothetical protein